MKQVLGLTFFDGPAHQALSQAHGLCVFPSAPGLATLPCDARYRQALVDADTRYVDSGFLTLAWFFLTGERLCRISGLRFLGDFLKSSQLPQQRLLWVQPDAATAAQQQAFLRTLPAASHAFYIAPRYPDTGPIADEELLEVVRTQHPTHIVICLGSGIQEPLGAWLKSHLSAQTTILCTGGALDLLCGTQVKIPTWADRLFLGWLWRILFTPSAVSQKLRASPLRRYLEAFKLWGILSLYKRQLPT